MVAAIVLGTVLVTLVTLDVVPAPQTSADGPTADPTHVVPSAAPILVDGQGCLVALDPALDDRLICTHDLGRCGGTTTVAPQPAGCGHCAPATCSRSVTACRARCRGTWTTGDDGCRSG